MITVPKLVLIIAVIIGVWYIVRMLNRGASALERRRQQPAPGRRAPGAVEELVPCRACGAYVAAGAPNCGRPACPQPR
jgi:hypothetical protein